MDSGTTGPTRWLNRLGLTSHAARDEANWEIEHHLAEFADRLVDEGWDAEEARDEARRRFGDPERYRGKMKRIEHGRVVMRKGTQWGDMLGEGLRSFIRTARRYPGFTLGVVLTLGLGIGANSTMYSIIDRLLLQPPEHITEPDRVKLVLLERPSPISDEILTSASLTYPDYELLKGHSGFVAAGFTPARAATVGEGDAAGPVQAALATFSFFEVAGVRPRIGRFFSDEETAVDAPLTVVLADEYWERTFDRDPAALGRTLTIQGQPATIIGVAPEGFTGLSLAPVDLWLPLEPTHVLRNGGTGCMDSQGCWWMWTAVRLRDGVSLESAEAEATALHLNSRETAIANGRYPAEARLLLTPLIEARGPQASPETRVAQWLAGVSAIVLLIACANVANLLMARSTRQRREISVRLALGASRQRVIALTILESLILAVAGGIVALGIARWGGWVVRSTLLPSVYFPRESWSLRLVGFTFAMALLAGLIAGLPPALQSRHARIGRGLVNGSRGASGRSSRFRTALTVSQGAMSVVLLVGAGLFIRSLNSLRSVDLGMDVEELIMIQPEFTSPELPAEATRAAFNELERRLAAVPGMASTTTTAVAFQWAYGQALTVPGLDSIPSLPGGGPYHYPVGVGYFETVGVRIEEGRGIEASDVLGSDPVVVVSRTMAEALWPDENALGKCIVLENSEVCTSVIGIAENAARGGYQDDPFMAYYLPLEQVGSEPVAIYARTRGPANQLTGAVASAVRASIPGVRYVGFRPLRELLDPQARSWTLGSTMFTLFGIVALMLAAIGLYGVLSFDVAQRTRELGIRSALGATQSRLMTSVVGRGSGIGLLGVGVGLAIAWFAGPFAESLLFETSPRDPVVLLSVAGILLLVCGLASLVPGLRATSVAPVDALRSE